MASTVIAGKPSNTVGEKDSTLILRGSSVKILWGNKFIDLIKNGKINVESKEDVLKKADSIDEAIKDGIYLIGEEVWFVSGGTKVNLTGTSDDLCVSFLKELEATSELKYLALTNIGFYYDTLQDAQDITAGLIYIASEGKLYIAKDGKFSEYKQEQTLEKLNELVIGDLKIHKDKGIMTITSPNLNIMDYITFQNENILTNKTLSIGGYLQSVGATSDYGYRLYMINGKSILEVDLVIERSELNTNEQQVLELNEIDYYTKHNNVISKVESIGNNQFKCSLKYTNLFDCDKVYVLMPVGYTVKAEIVNASLTESTIRVYILNGLTIEEDIQVTVEYDIEKTTTITILGGENDARKTISELATYANCVSSNSDKISINNINPKKIAYEFPIVVLDLDIIVTIENTPQQSIFLNNCVNALVCDSINPYIQINNNNLDVVDKSNTHTKIGIINKEEEPIKSTINLLDENGKPIVKNIESKPSIGVYSDNFLGINPELFNSIFKTDKGVKTYGTVGNFLKYPYYDNIILPIAATSSNIGPSEDLKLKANSAFNLIVPNIEWIKALIDFAIPIGTIIAWSGSSDNIPKGWEVCTELENKFIVGSNENKASTVGTAIDSEGKVQVDIESKHLPNHVHNIEAHTHDIEEHTHTANTLVDISDYNGSASDTATIYDDYRGSATESISEGEGSNVSVREISGWDSEEETIYVNVDISHGHLAGARTTIYGTALTTEENTKALKTTNDRNDWGNKIKLDITPTYYKLIFIKKVSSSF